jgi:2-polyprenyl-6-hydroxyphenyl methylase/3-demethylubiquinone-9 3-methyltransferase
MNTANADPRELAKFNALAARWWDPHGDFKPLHEINPLRLGYIQRLGGGLAGKRVLDVGCGGGILSEGMAREGAQVTAIDMAADALEVARLHLYESGLRIEYRHQPVEQLARQAAGHFDIVSCMEMLEHVPDPASVVHACAEAAKPGGEVFFSTLNRNPKSYLFAILGAEYLLRLLPKGTHDYARFIRPSELAGWCRAAGLEVLDLTGLHYNPLTRRYALGGDVAVNYLVHARKSG